MTTPAEAVFPALLVHDSILTVPAPPAVQETISEFIAAHQAELDALLAPHGVTVNEIARPTYYQIVTEKLLTTAGFRPATTTEGDQS